MNLLGTAGERSRVDSDARVEVESAVDLLALSVSTGGPQEVAVEPEAATGSREVSASVHILEDCECSSREQK